MSRLDVPIDSPPATHPFLKNILTVLTGTVAAQAIPLLIMPILTRVATPADIGFFTVWFGVVVVAGLLATGALQHILMVTSDGAEQSASYRSMVAFALAVSIVASVIGLVFAGQIGERLPSWTPGDAIALGFGIYATALTRFWMNYAVCRAQYPVLGQVRMAGALGTAVLQLALVMLWSPVHGLVWGYALGYMLSVVIGRIRLGQALLGGQPYAGHRQLTALLSKYRSFPLFTMPAALIDNFATQLPVMLVGLQFDQHSAGILGLVMRVLYAPTSVVAASVGDVFKQQASQDFIAKRDARQVYLRTLKILGLVGLIPMLALLLFGPVLFALVFGEQWREAGTMAQVVAPLLYTVFVASPLSYMLIISRRNTTYLAWQTGHLVIAAAVFLLVPTFTTAVLYYVIIYGLHNLLCLALCYRHSADHSPAA